MKLDFEKVFDRVDHKFLWETLLAMQLDLGVIALIQGTLVTNVEVKVHVNGLFTPSFLLERGVRQGDLISPLHFAMSSHPLMSLLNEKLSIGDLLGLRFWVRRALNCINCLLMMLESFCKIQR